MTEPRFVVTPKNLLTTLASLALAVMIGYIWWQVRFVTAPPTLQVVTPSHQTKVAIEEIEVAGKTDPGAVVSINNQIITQDKDGNFKETISLTRGINTIHVVATNRFQKQRDETLTVVREGEKSKEVNET